MSDTPRTDKFAAPAGEWDADMVVVPAEYCREIERELAEAKQQSKSGSEIGALLRDCRDALIDNDWDRIAVRHLIARLEAAIQAPPDSGGSDRMREALTLAASTFEHYGHLHRAKGTPDATQKAGDNEYLAEVMRGALAQQQSERGHSDIARKLLDPNIVHVNMLRGIIAPITMRQCAHVHGEAMVTWLNAVEELKPPPTRDSQPAPGWDDWPAGGKQQSRGGHSE